MNPPRQTAAIGDYVKFTCTSHNLVVWKYEHGPLRSNMLTTTEPGLLYHNLEIFNVQSGDSGVYSCYSIKEDKTDDSDIKFHTLGQTRDDGILIVTCKFLNLVFTEEI